MVDLNGPPAVKEKGKSNSVKVLLMDQNRHMVTEGIIMGKTTFQKVCQELAPSMQAASTICPSIPFSPAIYIIMVYPESCQTDTITIAQKAELSDVSHDCIKAPHPVTSPIAAKPSIKMNRQIKPRITPLIIFGIKIAVLQKILPKIGLCSSSAKSIPIILDRAVITTVVRIVNQKVRQKSADFIKVI